MLVRDETPVEFFREQLAKAMEHQRVSTSAFTEWYLVNLLAACVRGDALPAAGARLRRDAAGAAVRPRRPGVARRARAAAARCSATTRCSSPASSPTASTGKLVDLDYYRVHGRPRLRPPRREEAPLRLRARRLRGAGASASREFADLLAEVSETSRLAQPASLRAALRALAGDGQPPRRAAPGRARGSPRSPAAEATRHVSAIPGRPAPRRPAAARGASTPSTPARRSRTS